MQFEDIEMLDVPDDSSLTSENQTASMSDTSSGSASPAPKNYPSLQEYLEGKPLEFQFSASDYKRSAKATDDFSRTQSQYVSSLYKVVEGLHAKNITKIDDVDEPIGVISAAPDIGANKDREYANEMVNNAFRTVVESYADFNERVQGLVSESDAQSYEELSVLLESVQAECFGLSARQKPESIVSWVNRYDPKPENDFIDAVMYNNPEPYKHSQFWTLYLGTLLTRGMFEQAESSIRASKYEELESECPDLYAIVQDFVTLVSNYTTMSLKGQFAQWKYAVCEFRDNYKNMKGGVVDLAHVTIASQIHDLLCLISGLPKTTASFVSTWYEMYASLALFQVRDDDSVYSDYYRLAIAEKGSDVSNSLEQAMRDVISRKYLRVVLAIDSYDSATAAYVSKLFELKDFFSSYYVDLSVKSLPVSASKRYVSDYLLTRHAYSCLEVHDLVSVGMGLLLTPIVTASGDSITSARDVVAEFLPQYKCYTNDDLEWALTICAKLHLTDVVKKLYLRQGAKSLDDGHLFEAMNMFVQAYDENSLSAESTEAISKIHHVAWDLLFQDSLLNSSPVPDELLMNIVTNQVDQDFQIHPVIRQCIAPYAVLTDFFSSLGKTDDFDKTVSFLFHLLRFRYMPKRFMPLLLAQLLPFFAENKFETSQLVIIIELIDSFEIQAKGSAEEVEELYEYAIENVPEDVSHDWRSKLQQRGEEIPKTVSELVSVLRKKLMLRIGRAYIE